MRPAARELVMTATLPGRGYEHAEDLTPVPRVDLRHHAKFDTYPLPLFEPDHDPVHTAALDALMDEAFKPERCASKRCVRPEHPRWEPHEDADGNGWFPGEAPR